MAKKAVKKSKKKTVQKKTKKVKIEKIPKPSKGTLLKKTGKSLSKASREEILAKMTQEAQEMGLYETGREVYLPTGGTRKATIQDTLDSLPKAPCEDSDCLVAHCDTEVQMLEKPKPSLFQRIKNFFGLGE